MTLSEIRQKSAEGMLPEQLIPLLDQYISATPNDDEALTYRGLVHWSLGHRAAAINDYLAAIKINPQSKARQALESANQILDFYNKDLYNP